MSVTTELAAEVVASPVGRRCKIAVFLGKQSPQDAREFLRGLQDYGVTMSAVWRVLKRRGHVGSVESLRTHRSMGLCHWCEALKKELSTVKRLKS